MSNRSCLNLVKVCFAVNPLVDYKWNLEAEYNLWQVPKLLLHRIFPNARFSIWINGKLELVVDPHQILERFLWRKNISFARKNISFAISRHYRRFDVFEEAEANKAAGKYENASIDRQVEFYKKEGLTHYSSSKLPITSDVPEGCVIIREHIPITDLFTCLWFNEVDRFTSRDQISFSTVRDKIMSKVNWTVAMFLDCKQRNFVVQYWPKKAFRPMGWAVQGLGMDMVMDFRLADGAVERWRKDSGRVFGSQGTGWAAGGVRRVGMNDGWIEVSTPGDRGIARV
ncbi:hypothetical protein MRB53_026695 [Persea americana]|uniref:Uncharacterized protein n=1 Tax=Persea americana TaxID=3435 RepID=A0ACC2LJZ1_PERAE|nr:hypothetical protein MRB53_026695 [Persea americana]